jgi:hypothetical protein
MLAACSPPFTPLGVARVYSAGDLCRAMLATTGLPAALDTVGLDRTLRHDAERALLEVQAGVRWEALATLLGAEFLPGTVGESVAENSVGPDGQPLVRHVRALTLATADGELHRASRERDADLFRLAIGGFGAFGPFYSLTLDVASRARSAAMATAPARIAVPDARVAGPRFSLELLVPLQQSDAVVGQIRAALEERRCSMSLLEARPVLADSTTFLHWAGNECVALRIEYGTRPTLGGCAGAAQIRARLIDLAIAASGSVLPRMLPLATRVQAAACYPMLAAFLAEKRRLDPAERVVSPWYRGVRRAWRAETCRVRWAKD